MLFVYQALCTFGDCFFYSSTLHCLVHKNFWEMSSCLCEMIFSALSLTLLPLSTYLNIWEKEKEKERRKEQKTIIDLGMFLGLEDGEAVLRLWRFWKDRDRTGTQGKLASPCCLPDMSPCHAPCSSSSLSPHPHPSPPHPAFPPLLPCLPQHGGGIILLSVVCAAATLHCTLLWL